MSFATSESRELSHAGSDERRLTEIERIAVAVNPDEQVCDAAYLAAAIAGATEAEVTLVTVLCDPAVPSGIAPGRTAIRERVTRTLGGCVT